MEFSSMTDKNGNTATFADETARKEIKELKETGVKDQINTWYNNHKSEFGTGSSDSGMTEEQVNTAIKEWFDDSTELDKKIADKINKVVNTVNNPFQTAYWKDSTDNSIYLVEVKNGQLKISKQGVSENTDASQLEDLAPDRLLIWHDEFEGNTLSDSWNVTTGERVIDSNTKLLLTKDCVKIDNSILHLSAYNGNFTDENGNSYKAKGAMIDNRQHGNVRYGLFEAKIRMSTDNNTFPAFWLMGAGAQWAKCGEIDIMEYGLSANAVTVDYHWTNGSNYNKAKGSITYCRDKTKIKEWNIYGAEVDAENVYVYFNRELVNTFKHSDITDYYKELNYNASAINPFTRYMKYIIFDTFVNNNTNTNTSEMFMEVDWCRIYAPQEVTEVNKITEIKPTIAVYQENYTYSFSYITQFSGRRCMGVLVKTNDNNNVVDYELTSDNEEVARVTAGGNLLINKTGTFTLTATTKDGVTGTNTITII